MTLRLGMTTIGLIVLASAGMAADSSDWANVESLHAGDKIGIVRRNQPLVEGELAKATATAIQVRTDGGRTMEIEKESVLSVYRHPVLSRKKRVLIGLAVGAAAGGAIAAGIGSRSNGEGFFNGRTQGAAIGAAMGGGAGVGAAIAAATGGGRKIVYQRR